jgi:hypothetical protein
MSLINCPECNNKISDMANNCPKCGYPLKSGSQNIQVTSFDSCRSCGGKLRKTSEAKSEGSGCLILILGIFLTPFIIGIFLIIFGLHLMMKKEGFWYCTKCKQKFPRKIDWFELG